MAKEFYWSFQDESNAIDIRHRYEDREAIASEMVSKAKALEKMEPDNPFYQRAAVAAEMAQMRYDMAYIVAENYKLRDMVSSVSWLHQQLDILTSAYSHMKMLAARCEIEYGMISNGLKQIEKLKKELENANTARSDGSAG